MKLDEMMREWDEDCKIDRTALDIESLRVPELHNKWFKLYTAERVLYIDLMDKRKALLHWKTQYYAGELNNEEDCEKYKVEPFQFRLSKSKQEQAVDADGDVRTLARTISMAQEKQRFLEGVIKSINGRQWNIRGAIDYAKFTNPG